MNRKFNDWMQGRYGTDQLNRFLNVIILILLVISIFTRSTLLDLIAVVLLVLEVYRTFSRNIEQRREENRKYLEITGAVTGFFRGGIRQARDKDHLYFKCPNCGQKVRVPKYKGHIEITCPKCRTKFVKDTGKLRG